MGSRVVNEAADGSGPEKMLMIEDGSFISRLHHAERSGSACCGRDKSRTVVRVVFIQYFIGGTSRLLLRVMKAACQTFKVQKSENKGVTVLRCAFYEVDSLGWEPARVAMPARV